MPRYKRSDSHIVFNPTVLKLTTNKHRAALDGSEVSLLTGRDPREYGSIGRFPGGKRINETSYPSEDAYIYRAGFFERRGILEGHWPRTKLTETAYNTANKWDVESTAGFEVGDWVCTFDLNWTADNARCSIGHVNVIDSTTRLDIDLNSTSDSVPSGSWVIKIPFREFAGSSSITTDGSNNINRTIPGPAFGLKEGMTCYLLASDDQSATLDEVTIASLSTGTPGQIQLTAPANEHGNEVTNSRNWTLVPKFLLNEDYAAVASLSTGNIEVLDTGTWSEVYDPGDNSDYVGVWDSTIYDRSIMMVNGGHRAFRLNEYNKVESLGFPEVSFDNMGEAELNTESDAFLSKASSDLTGSPPAAVVTAGDHRIFLRLLDYGVRPAAKTPPLGVTNVTVDGTYTYILGNISGMIGELNNQDFIETAYRRCMHYEVWMTIAGGGTYYLADSGHISKLSRFSSSTEDRWRAMKPRGLTLGYTDAFLVNISDEALVLKDSLDPNDYDKGQIPLGKFIKYYQGITFVAGETDVDYAGEHPKIESANQVWFSRTDTEEPENFPSINFKTMGHVGDEVMGFVEAAESMLILSKFTFTVVQRLGSFITFTEGGVAGQGLAHADAYVSLGTHCAWVSDQAIWLFDGRSMDHPVDIGFPIRDWVEDLLTDTVDRVRMGYDPVHRLLYVGKIEGESGSGHTAECMVYNFDDNAWTKLEDVVLDAPVTAYGMESSTTPWHLYRFSGGYDGTNWNKPNVYQLYDGTSITQSGESSTGLSGTTGSLGSISQLTFAWTGDTNADALAGSVIRFDDGTIKIIYESSHSGGNTTVKWDGAKTLNSVGWIIDCIPFRLRFPPIRGQDPFSPKIGFGAQVMFDNVSVSQNMTVNLYRNFRSSTDTGGSGTLAISTDASKVDRDLAVNVQGTGKTLELELVQATTHGDFSIVYAGLNVGMPGTLREDASTSV